jgi:serine/threonine protein phosphatase PrpC
MDNAARTTDGKPQNHEPTAMSTPNGHRGNLIECQHCHKLTSVGRLQLPPASSSETIDDLNARVLKACQGAARTANASSSESEKIYKLFELCLPSSKANSCYDPKSPSKKLIALQKRLKKWPSLISVRSGNFQQLCPDGFTLLHFACYQKGNAEVVDFLLKEYVLKESSDEEEERLDIHDTNVLGRTAQHIAADQCNFEILRMLRDAFEVLEEREMCNGLEGLSTDDATTEVVKPKKSPKRSPVRFAGKEAPKDLANKTPLALAATSKLATNSKAKAQSTQLLYAKGEPCVDGVDKTPPLERCGNKSGMLSPLRAKSTKYMSPTPKLRRVPMSCDTNYATPFSSPPLSSAVTTVEEGLNWGVSEKPGWRIEMEDAVCCVYPVAAPPPPAHINRKIPTLGLFGVFDGHGDGGYASKFLATNLLDKLSTHSQWSTAYHSIDSDSNSSTEGDGAMMTLLEESFHALDTDLMNDDGKVKNGGSTAIVAVVSEGKMFIANVGDSRCILVKKRMNEEGDVVVHANNAESLEVIPLSEDHKPNLPSERARIEAAGMTIYAENIPAEGDKSSTIIHKIQKSQQDTGVSFSRAFGDFDYKSNPNLSSTRQAVICTPETCIRERKLEEDMYLILACDGVWDVMSDDEVGLFVANHVQERCLHDLEKDDILAKVGDDLLDHCLDKGSTDNMSVLILSFPASGFKSLGLSGGVCSVGLGGAKKLAF